jgi:hypothetical protein
MALEELDIKAIRSSLEELRAKLAQLRGHL